MVQYMAMLMTCSTLGCSTDFATDATTVPHKPKSVSLGIVDEQSVQVFIEPPLDDGGADILKYQVNAFSGWCLRVVVLDLPSNTGYLDVFVNDGSVFQTVLTGYQNTPGSTVLNSCYNHAFAGVEVEGTNDDGIAVSVEVQWVGESSWSFMECTSGCTGGLHNTSSMTVDLSNDNAPYSQPHCWCDSGTRCGLSPFSSGIIHELPSATGVITVNESSTTMLSADVYSCNTFGCSTNSITAIAVVPIVLVVQVQVVDPFLILMTTLEVVEKIKKEKHWNYHSNEEK
jgi:hypothetical protein